MRLAKLIARLVRAVAPRRSGGRAVSSAIPAAVALLAKLCPERFASAGYRYAYESAGGRYVALLSRDYTCQVVDLQAARYLHVPDASPRGFDGTRLKMEGDSRFDGFPLMPDIEVIDLTDPALPWRDTSVPGAPLHPTPARDTLATCRAAPKESHPARAQAPDDRPTLETHDADSTRP
jgi:hypothetical protein